MRAVIDSRLEFGRHRGGRYGSKTGERSGAFLIKGPCGERLKIIACTAEPEEAEGWEHVSVSVEHRTPNWTEMCWVKDLFWDEEECVVQFHPPKSRYVNCHPYCLHLWKQVAGFPQPPIGLV